ncbi:hypothetical protein KRP22_003858 [Phytophthora ramorum]|nr:Cytochrome P450 704C1 [Phytophthora ramorum]
MWSSTSHDGAQQSVLMALGALTVVYASWKILNLPVPMPDPGMEQLFRPASTLPVLGNTLDVLLFNRYRMSDWINDQTDASSGQPWILQLLFQPPWVVLSMPNDLHDVFVDQFQVFEKGGTLGDISFDVLGNGLLNVNGDKWKQQRRAASHLFSTQSIRDVMEPVIREKTLQLRDVLAQSAGRKQTVSMKSLLGKFTSDVFTRIGFGVELDQLGGDVFKDEQHPLDIALHAVQNRFQTPAWMWKLARFLNVGAEKRLRESMKTVNDMVRDIMVRSISEKSSGDQKKNLLTLLMKDNAAADPRELQDTAVNFFIAGKDTTSFSLSWLIVMMNRYPRVLQKIREEIRSVLPTLLTGEMDAPTLEDTQKLAYLDAAVKESVRLQAVSTYRCTTRDTTLTDGAFIKKGTVVVVSKYAAARRKGVWGEDAAEYKPERWFDEKTGEPKNITPPQFITFSTGPRKCIGMRLAMLEMKTVMAVLFSRFDIETVEDPFKITYDFSFVLPVKGPLALATCCRFIMDEGHKQQLRDDLQFAIMKAEQLTVLDPKAPAGLKKNPMDIKALVDVFAVFGFSPDDIIDKHDQCTIFRKIRAELDELLGDLAVNTKKYDKAILLRDRLRLIKLEFVEMQGTYETRRQYQEKQQFSRGIVLAKQRSDVLCESRTDACEREILLKQEELRKTQEVERVQLETYLTKLQEPHVKFSKLLLELKNTEKNLARLKLFEDAKNVFVRADSMERDQRALRTAKFERFKENKRALLLEKQQQELAEVKEKLMEKRYVVMRANDNHRKTEVQRMENLTSDMKHAHTKDMYGKKVFSTNAEATVRKSHGVTSSTYRGQQLLSTVQGKRLEVASLCLLHDSENGVVPPGSIIYTG